VHPAALEVAALGMVAGMFACESHLAPRLNIAELGVRSATGPVGQRKAAVFQEKSP
jgi:hypothetical protein